MFAFQKLYENTAAEPPTTADTEADSTEPPTTADTEADSTEPPSTADTEADNTEPPTTADTEADSPDSAPTTLCSDTETSHQTADSNGCSAAANTHADEHDASESRKRSCSADREEHEEIKSAKTEEESSWGGKAS